MIEHHQEYALLDGVPFVTCTKEKCDVEYEEQFEDFHRRFGCMDKKGKTVEKSVSQDSE